MTLEQAFWRGPSLRKIRFCGAGGRDRGGPVQSHRRGSPPPPPERPGPPTAAQHRRGAGDWGGPRHRRAPAPKERAALPEAAPHLYGSVVALRSEGGPLPLSAPRGGGVGQCWARPRALPSTDTPPPPPHPVWPTVQHRLCPSGALQGPHAPHIQRHPEDPAGPDPQTPPAAVV